MIKIEVLTRSKSASWIFDFFKLSFVGSSPTLHPEENHPTLFFVLLTRAYTRSYYIYYTGTPFLSASVGWSTPIFAFSPF